MLKKIWMDEGGATLSAELALIGTILVIGVVVGLSAVQDAVNTELADLGSAIGSLDQTYSTGGASGHHAAVNASAFGDGLDSCDDDCAQPADANSRCVALCLTKTSEGGAPGGGTFVQ